MLSSHLKTLSFWILLVSISTAQAETIDAEVIGIDAPAADDVHLIYLDSGRVLRVSDEEKARLFEGAMIVGERVRALVSEESGLDRIDSVSSSTAVVAEEAASASADEPWTPTELPDLETATKIHQQLTGATLVDSICANRAHIWTYRMWRDHGVKSNKAFLFFTPRYIRNYRGKWWYHVTPYLHAAGQEFATDRTFFKKPIPLAAWASHFVKNRFECPVIEKYSDYIQGKKTGYCYLRKVPGPVWWPAEVLKMDSGHVPSNRVSTEQVRSAVREALTRKARRNFTY